MYTSQAGGEERRINHFHYVDWPDFNVPKVVSQQNILGHIFLVLVTIIYMIVIKTSIIAILNPLYSVTGLFPGILAQHSSPSNIQSIFIKCSIFLKFSKIQCTQSPDCFLEFLLAVRTSGAFSETAGPPIGYSVAMLIMIMMIMMRFMMMIKMR